MIGIMEMIEIMEPFGWILLMHGRWFGGLGESAKAERTQRT